MENESAHERETTAVLDRATAAAELCPESADLVSVVVCTLNRAASLQRTLEALASMTFADGLRCEIIVVDNGSSDETREVVRTAASRHPVRYIYEGQRGACNARNRGAREARGAMVAFIDDDVLVSGNWLGAILDAWAKYPETAMFFGRTETAHPDLPRLAIREGDAEEVYTFPCNPRAPGASNNVACRKDVVARVGGWDASFGPGTRLSAAEDVEFTYRVLRSGATVRYAPAMLAYHDHHRVSPADVRSVLFAYGKGIGGFYCKYIVRRDLWATKLCWWEVRYWLRRLFTRKKHLRSVLHLAGMAAGFFVRLGDEVKVKFAGSRALRRNGPSAT